MAKAFSHRHQLMDIEKADTSADYASKVLVSESKTPIDRVQHAKDISLPDNPYVVDLLAERRLLRKMDMRILPACMVIYTLSFLDRSNIGNAKILNANVGDSLQQATHITDSQYLGVLVIFFIAYAIFELPSNYCLKHFFPSRWLAFLMFGWGATTMIQSAVHDFAALAGVRFLLGAFEAGLFPGIIYYLTFWYRPNERAVRIALIVACATLGGAFGGSIAYGVGFTNEDGGIQAWRWLCIIEGGLTCLLAALVFFILPDYPETGHWLTPAEREIAVNRIKGDAPQGLANISLEETRNTLFDLRLYLHYFAFLCVSPPFASFSLFTPTIVSGLGFQNLAAQLFTVPPFAAAFTFVVGISYIADRYERWSLAALTCLVLSGLSFIVQGALPARFFAARYVVLCLCTCFSFACNPLLLSFLTSNIYGTSAMTLGVPMNVTLATAGQIIGLFIYKSREAPGYPTGHYTNAGFMLLGAVIVAYLRFIYIRRNRHLAPGQKRWRV